MTNRGGYNSDYDGPAAALAEQFKGHERQLSGSEALLIQRALEAADAALTIINVKGLTFAHRQQVALATELIRQALRIRCGGEGRSQ